MKNTVIRLHETLSDLYGNQGWWPVTTEKGKPPIYRPGREGRPVSEPEAFEIIVGSILTQNTAWLNVEKALVNLSQNGLLDIRAVAGSDGCLETAIRPAGYYNQKALRLREISRRIADSGGIRGLRETETAPLRKRLLSWKGIGPETADSILCYALSRPVFVVDAYTRRLFGKLDLPNDHYDDMQGLVHEAMPPSAAVYSDFHARIVKTFAMKEAERVVDLVRHPNQGQYRKTVLSELQTIPGVGDKIARDLWDIGIRSVGDLKQRDPLLLYERLNQIRGVRTDRCMLYVFRCAVYFASEKHPEPEKLKWWHWKARL